MRLLSLAILLIPVALALGVPHTQSPEEILGWFTITIAWSAAAFLITHLAARPEDQRTLLCVFLGALGIRLTAAVICNFWVHPAMFAEDDGPYDQNAWALASYWQGFSTLRPELRGERGYYYLLATVYSIFGRAYLAGVALNAGCGALLTTVAYRIALEFTSRSRVALRAAVIIAILPSLVLWSAMLVRDAWTSLLLALGIYLLARVQRGNLLSLLGLLAVMAGLLQFRSYLLLGFGAGAALALTLPLARQRPRRLVVGLLALGALVVVQQQLGIGGDELKGLTPERLATMRKSLATGGSAYFGSVDLSSPEQALAFLPIGLAYFLLGPFPWMMGELRHLMTLPDLLGLYICLIPAVRAAVRGFRYEPQFTASLVLPTVVILLAYSLVSANLGTAYRHRSQLLTPIVILAAVGMELGRAGKDARRRHGEVLTREAIAVTRPTPTFP